ncbi:MAG: hypothetical protein E7536_03195 [Ruminococcaceae bacterium]|nr:hypothetical protein [Oscillospiraceae bacterium]
MNGIKVDIAKRKIIINKTFSKKMSNTSSPEYREYERVVSLNPTFEIEIKTQKTYDHDKYKGLGYDFIEAYIYCHELDIESRNAVFAEYVEERWKAKGHSEGFSEVRAWFLYKYPDFDNMYFKRKAEPPRSKVEELVNFIASINGMSFVVSSEKQLLTE